MPFSFPSVIVVATSQSFVYVDTRERSESHVLSISETAIGKLITYTYCLIRFDDAVDDPCCASIVMHAS